VTQQAMLIQKIRKGPPCSVGLLLESLPDDEAAALNVLLDSPMLGTDIAAHVYAEGYADIAGGTYSRHRRGACCCERFGA
jgi:hypothetical protein